MCRSLLPCILLVYNLAIIDGGFLAVWLLFIIILIILSTREWYLEIADQEFDWGLIEEFLE